MEQKIAILKEIRERNIKLKATKNLVYKINNEAIAQCKRIDKEMQSL